VLVQLYFKYRSDEKYRRKFRGRFPGEPVPSKHGTHYLVNKLKTAGSLLDKKPDWKRNVLTEEKLDDIGSRLETSPRKSLKRLAPGDERFENVCTKGHKIVITATV
jgi:hypothetical protein